MSLIERVKAAEPRVLDGRALDVALALAMGCTAEYYNPIFAYCRCPDVRHGVFNELTGATELPSFSRSLEALKRVERPFLDSDWHLDVAIGQGWIAACWYNSKQKLIAAERGETEEDARARVLLGAYRSVKAVYRDGVWCVIPKVAL